MSDFSDKNYQEAKKALESKPYHYYQEYKHWYSLQYHIAALKIAETTYRDSLPTKKDCQAYLKWCEDNKFPAVLDKGKTDRQKEIAFWKEKLISKANKSFRKFRKSPARLIQLICKESIEKSEEDLLTDQYATLRKLLVLCRFDKKLVNTIKQVAAKSKIITEMPDPFIKLVQYSNTWIRDGSDWVPNSHNITKQFSHLARHLLCNYPVPIFMDSVWKETSEYIHWFQHIGLGNNLRTASMPEHVSLTKKNVHYFLQAPNDYSIEEAIMWGQVHSLGGDERTCNALRGTPAIRDFAHNEFWQSVYRFFIDNPMLDTNQYGPLIDYLLNQKFYHQELFVDGEFVTMPPPQPNLTMKGRTADALIAHMENWHYDLSKLNKVKENNFKPSGYQSKTYTFGSGHNQTLWMFKELLSTKALIAEGKAMNSCVGSYSNSCSTGRSSIWTMEKQNIEGITKQVTIEVARKNIVQVRGKHNVRPTQQQMQVLRLWASDNKLSMSSWI